MTMVPAQNKYKNFVPAGKLPSVETVPPSTPSRYLSGHDARLIYLNVVRDSKPSTNERTDLSSSARKQTRQCQKNPIKSNKQAFIAAEDNNHNALMLYLSANPEKLNSKDEYGWSLLMIACQANAVQTVKMLLQLGVDTSVRDKAGNSARTLLIKQKNVELINVMLSHKSMQEVDRKKKSIKGIEPYQCLECQKTFRDQKEHLSSTIHNIKLSKSKKPRTWYGIPETNRGYQILIKSGWDRENGLGPEGEGNKYPIKPVMKQDRKGLGAVKKKATVQEEDIITNVKSKRKIESELKREKIIEKSFRREFYDYH